MLPTLAKFVITEKLQGPKVAFRPRDSKNAPRDFRPIHIPDRNKTLTKKASDKPEHQVL